MDKLKHVGSRAGGGGGGGGGGGTPTTWDTTYSDTQITWSNGNLTGTKNTDFTAGIMSVRSVGSEAHARNTHIEFDVTADASYVGFVTSAIANNLNILSGGSPPYTSFCVVNLTDGWLYGAGVGWGGGDYVDMGWGAVGAGIISFDVGSNGHLRIRKSGKTEFNTTASGPNTPSSVIAAQQVYAYTSLSQLNSAAILKNAAGVWSFTPTSGYETPFGST